MFRWLWISVFVFALDQGSKWLAESYLTPHQPAPIIPSFNMKLMYNQGAAFSILDYQGGWQRWVFSGIALAISVALVFWLRGLKPDQRWIAASLALVLGGALGNLYDRLVLWKVVDFIQIHYQQWYLPVFNIADLAIAISVTILLIDAIFCEGKRRST